MLSTYSDDIIARLATGLEAADRQPFYAAAEAALTAMPPAMLGPGSTWRAVESVWRKFFKPPTTSHQPQTEPRERPPRIDRRTLRTTAIKLRPVECRGRVYPSRAALATALAPLCGDREPIAIANRLRKFSDDANAVVEHYADKPRPRSANFSPPA